MSTAGHEGVRAAVFGKPRDVPDIGGARAHHQAGRLRDAESAYRALLAVKPDDAVALHGLGVLRHQAGDSLAARDLLTRAAAGAPEAPEHHFNLGLTLARLGEHGAAAAAFAEAARLRPGWAEPHYDRGRALHADGWSEQAAQAYRAALKVRPDFFQAEVNLGNALLDAGKPEQAVAAYRRVLRRRPHLAEVHHALGRALLAQKDSNAAETAFRAALQADPDSAAAGEALARLLVAAKRWAEALPYVTSACRLAPDRADLSELLGQAQAGAGHANAAIAAYEAALALAPNRHSARFGLAEALRMRRSFSEAEALLSGLVMSMPHAWLAHHDHGNVLRDLGRFEEAEAAYRRALALAETPLALNHLAAVLRDLGRLEEAQSTAERGLALAPDDSDLQYNLAITHLTAGRWRDGFALYEIRGTKYGAVPPPGRPWTGQALRGHTILVAAEQGLGDTIQFLRYLPALAELGARVILRVPAPLLALATKMSGVHAVVSQDAQLPKYDFHVALMSLPHRLGLDDPCPVAIPYLAADDGKVTHWASRLAHLPAFKVGLVWAGNPGFKADHLRSIPPNELAALGDVPGIALVSLQKDPRAWPGLPMADWTHELHDMSETAALIAALDLVVGVDTAVIHLAGALGKPVWLLNRADTCWRWGRAGEGCAWYPTLRQFRQSIPGRWDQPIAQVAASLTTAAMSS